MLSDLPSEIIYQIAVYLPTANALASLAQTCHRLHDIITAEDSRIFRAFVKSRFPSIKTPPYWKDAAQALTCRSRALDRNAVIGRFVVPPQNAIKVGSHQAVRNDNPTHGYRPAIDSYEVWNGDRWADRKEVLVWGAADELAVRIKQGGTHEGQKWLVFNDLNHISSYDDICGVHLLKPEHPSKEEDKEHLIFGRVRGELLHLAISPDTAGHEYKQRFMTYGLVLERIELSNVPEPILAAHFLNGSIALYHTTTGEAEVEPFAQLQNASDGASRIRYSKFLSPSRIAIGTGRLENSLSIFAITPEQVSVYREIGVDSLDFEEHIGMRQATSFSLLGVIVRLHDLRSPEPYEYTYRDTTDHNPIYSIHPFSHDRFLVGAGGDAVLKIFDLRMPNTYSYLDANGPAVVHHASTNPPHSIKASTADLNGFPTTVGFPRKDFSIFLSHLPPGMAQPSRGRGRGNRSYRGAIYTMSSPSPSSPTVYTGVENGIFRLDFASTDDLHGSSRRWYQDYLSCDPTMSQAAAAPDRIVELSGYERPEPEDLTTTSKLRIQQPFRAIEQQDVWNEVVTGWDRRWVKLGAEAAWRRRD
ncbi:hypothetical protein MW887_010338 [Aspergillus wentii]|nr:hypothetical protein MW887_010338 [Aspergillus wentii]